MKTFVKKPESEQSDTYDDDTGQGTEHEESAAGGRNRDVDFRGEKRSNKTHASTTDPDARLHRKSLGQSSRLYMMGHIVTENRNGMIVEAEVSHATGTAERETALKMLDRLPKRPKRTVGADKGNDTKDFVKHCRDRKTTPYVAAKAKHSAIDTRTSGTPVYAITQRKRKRIEEPFG